MMSNVIRFIENFKSIGYWELNDNFKSNKSLADLHLKGIAYVLDELFIEVKDLIYLFKTETEILYIGETTGNLRQRFTSYRYGFDKFKDTDNRVKIGLTKELCMGNTIEIMYYQPVTEFEIGGQILRISLSKPIEKFLISQFRPKLNQYKVQ